MGVLGIMQVACLFHPFGRDHTEGLHRQRRAFALPGPGLSLMGFEGPQIVALFSALDQAAHALGQCLRAHGPVPSHHGVQRAASPRAAARWT